MCHMTETREKFKIFFGFYRVFFSPFIHSFFGVQAGCRFEPSCSRYALEALERRGFVFGGIGAISRILRCHPWSRGGWDPVFRKNVSGE